ncbi:MAG: DUF3187 family protein [Arenicella sp.]
MLFRKSRRAALVASCLLCLVHGAANATSLDESRSFSPFFVTNNLPVSIGLGLPKTLSSSPVAVGETAFDINVGIKSNANDAGSDTETLLLDGETQSLDLGVSYGLTERLLVDAQLSYIKHSSGNLDGLIQNWHDLFGLDEGDRPLFERDSFLYAYSQNDQDYALAEPSSGISDLRIGLGYAVNQHWVDNMMMRLGLSLPTGDKEKLTGSDKIDIDLGVYMSGRGLQHWRRLGWHANISYLWIGDDESLGIRTKKGTWFNSFGAYWAINSRWTAKSQIDSHGAMFESAISELNRSASELTFGLAYQSTKVGLIEVYFSEDITVNRSADFSFGISSKVNF